MPSGRRFLIHRLPGAFTLIEVLVGTVVLALILVLMVAVVVQASSVWKRSSEKVEAFQSARLAFDLITRNLSQATLNTYLDYDSATAPTRYLRKSELAFICGAAGTGDLPGVPGSGQALFFQAPLGYATNAPLHGGLEALLNTCGYYVSYTTNNSLPAHVATATNAYRFRLMQMFVPTESNTVYQTNSEHGWFKAFTNSARPVADNIIALVIRPQDPAATPPDIGTYDYDTRVHFSGTVQPDTSHQLPPVIQITLIAIDEAAANRMDSDSAIPAVLSTALTGKFQMPANYDTDLRGVEDRLNEQRIPYRVFSSAVPIRESKWTK